jgi:hypothetical protein
MAPVAKTAVELVDWVLAKAQRTVNGCLECHLKPNKAGYSPIQVGGRGGIKWRVHRLVYSVKKGEVPRHLMVLHSCDNRRCIELNHLFIGTAKDNTQDMMNKGRHKYITPNNQKIDPQRIYNLYNKGYDRFDIAGALDISPTTVWNYISNRGPYYGK